MSGAVAQWARGLSLHGRWRRTYSCLRAFRPRLRDRRFWVVQGLVLLVAFFHTGVEMFDVLSSGSTDVSNSLCFVPVAFFFIPVVYAALVFGFSGSVATALLCTAFAVPNLVSFHHGLERFTELVQIIVVDGIGIFVGYRIESELYARRRAEAIGAALRVSEAKYRGLFETSPVAVLVLDLAGNVLEANPEAQALFGGSANSLRGLAVADLLGREAAASILDPAVIESRQDGDLTLTRADGSEAHLAPSLTRASEGQQQSVIQVVLRDVTEQHYRQAGLRAYAAHILRAQEEAHKRIAQELHDDTVQELILLCRQLDLVEAAGGALSATALRDLQEARRSAEGIVEGLRNFARSLRPPTLDDLGLVASLRRLLVEFGERSRAAGHLQVVGEERRLPPHVAITLFRIAQEALRNVERHARARQVVVTVSFSADGVGLRVLDNGVGFVAKPAVDFAARGHLGLLGMRERAESLGGRLDVSSEPGEGTSLTVFVPLADAAVATTAECASTR